MKKIFLLNILIVFGISFLQAQQSKLDSVITKFQNDSRSFEEFILLGKMECYSKILDLEIKTNGWTDLYTDMYVRLYNSLTPFARLFKEQLIKKNIEEYFSLNIKHFEKLNSREAGTNKEKSHYYEKIKICDCLFDKNEDYKKLYIQFVSNKENYIAPTNDIDSFTWEEIESFKKNYLENYFIKILDE